jgi:hypothetical protein
LQRSRRSVCAKLITFSNARPFSCAHGGPAVVFFRHELTVVFPGDYACGLCGRRRARDETPMPRVPFTDVSMRSMASLAAAMIVVAAVAADAPVAPAPPELPQVPAGASTQSGIPGCAVWTDRCVVCERGSGVIACSNIGIACQPQALQCLRAEAAEEKRPANDPSP